MATVGCRGPSLHAGMPAGRDDRGRAMDPRRGARHRPLSDDGGAGGDQPDRAGHGCQEGGRGDRRPAQGIADRRRPTARRVGARQTAVRRDGTGGVPDRLVLHSQRGVPDGMDRREPLRPPAARSRADREDRCLGRHRREQPGADQPGACRRRRPCPARGGWCPRGGPPPQDQHPTGCRPVRRCRHGQARASVVGSGGPLAAVADAGLPGRRCLDRSPPATDGGHCRAGRGRGDGGTLDLPRRRLLDRGR